MDLGLLFTGIGIGFSVAAPVGPIGLLCIRRSLEQGWRAGFASGLGAATADALYGCVAALGLGIVTAALAGAQFWLRLAGGLLLCLIGVQAMLAQPASHAGAAPVPGARGLAGAYAVTFGLTLTNPMTILAYAAILTGAGATLASGQGGAGLLIAGVFLGSALWWLLLSGATGLLRSRLSPGILPWINRAAGLLIVGFGVWVLRQLV